MLIAALAALCGCGWAPQPGAPAAPGPSPAPAATPSPECAGESASVTVDAPPAPRVGETITVTVRLTNLGCGVLGQPGLGLTLSSADGATLTDPAAPEGVVHAAALRRGDSASYSAELRLVAAGRLTLEASASYEFISGRPGGDYWRGAKAPPVTIEIRTEEGATVTPSLATPAPLPPPTPTP